MEETKSLSATIVNALKAKGISVEKLAQVTGISDRFLESLVEENFEALPSSPYVRGYLIRIAGVLGLDGEALWSEYLKDNEAIRSSGKDDHLPRNRFSVPRLMNIKVILAGVLVLGVVLYVVVKVVPLFSSQPGLELLNLESDITVTENSVFTLLGAISPAYKLTLNGERIYPDKNGNFEKAIPLHDGFNTLVFGVKKLLREEQTFSKQIFYKAVEENISQNGSRQEN